MADEIDNILADVKQEGDPNPFADMGKDTPPSSPAGDQPEGDKPDQGEPAADAPKDNTDNEDNLPFHKHPRWIERDNELNSLKEREEERERELAELRSFKEETERKFSHFERTEGSKIPNWFVELYGENEAAWQAYSEHEKAQREEIKREAIAELEQRSQQAVQEEERWVKWAQDSFTKLEGKGYQFDRNELADVMVKYRPTDENNNLDFEAGYEILTLQKQKEAQDPVKSHARKAIADVATKSSTGEKTKKDYLSSHDLRGKSWNQL